VRAEAIRTLKLSGREDLKLILEKVADSDPSQLVRYEAQLALYEMNGGPVR
jgi:hypothetical protein